MKVIKGSISVDDVINLLSDKDKEIIKCAYFNDVEYSGDDIFYSIVIDNENEEDLEEYSLTPNPPVIDPMQDEDPYFEYLKNNYDPETDGLKE